MKILYNGFNIYEPSEIYLCTPNRIELAYVHGIEAKCVLRLNDISEFSIKIPKYIRDVNGHKVQQGCYDLIKTKRLLHVTNIGWFEIKEVNDEHNDEGEYLTVVAYSHQYALQRRGFYTEERVYSFYNSSDPTDANYDASDVSAIPSVIGQLCQQLGIKLDLQYTDAENDKNYDSWTITYIDDNIRFPSDADGVYRTLKDNTTTGYEFMIETVESAFEIIWIFDFEHHTIKAKSVSNVTTQTDIYLSFDNLIKSLQVKENAEDIVTVLTCVGTDLDIRTVNPMGTGYIVNFDYYKDKDGNWMSQELINALDAWKELYNTQIEPYKQLVKALREKFENKTKTSIELQKTQLKISDLENARDQYIDKYPLIAETVYSGNKSSDTNSSLSNINFSDNLKYDCYIKAPEAQNGNYVFTSTSKNDTVINNYNSGYIYFQDEDKTTYCKLIKDENSILGYERYGQYGNIYEWCSTNENTGVIISVESVGVSNYSLDESSTYYNTVFDGKDITKHTLYKNTPMLDENKNFVGGEESIQATFEEGREAGYLYFLEGSTNTYCKLVESANIDVESNTAIYYVSGFVRYAMINSASQWIRIYEKHCSNIEDSNNDLDTQIKGINEEMAAISSQCNILKFIANYDKTGKLSRELECYWSESEYKNDTLAVTEETTLEETLDLADELMKSGEAQLEKKAQPSFSFNIESVDFVKLPHFKRFAEELKLGRTVTIEKSENVVYIPALTEISFNLYDLEDFALTFSNSAKLNSNEFTFADIIGENNKVSKSVSSNWQDLISYSKNKETISDLLANPLNKILRAGMSNMTNQEFTIDNTGILGRKYLDETKTEFSKEQMRIMNNSILFTDDAWETIKTALGRIYYDYEGTERSAYGLAAQTIIGSLVMSETLNIKNIDSSLTLDESGLIIRSGDTTVFTADISGNVEMIGKIIATEGYIGSEKEGFLIDSNSISHNMEDESTRVLICTGSSESYKVNGSAEQPGWMLLAGENFGVTNTGELYATSGNIAGLTIVREEVYDNDTYVGLYSMLKGSNFILASAVDEEGTASDNYLAFTDADGNQLTLINNDGVKAVGGDFEYVTATSVSGESGMFGDLVSSSLNINDTFLIVGNKVGYYVDDVMSSGFTFGGEGYTRTLVTATLTAEQAGVFSGFKCTLTVSLNKPLEVGRNFYVSAKDAIGQNTKSTTIWIGAGGTSGSGSLSTGIAGMSSWWFTGASGANVYSWSGTKLYLYQGIVDNSVTISVTGNLIPTADNTYTIGSTSNRWGQIYSSNSAISTSDRSEKNTIEALSEKYNILFDALKPVSFKFNEGTSGRKHTGFIADEVKEAVEKAGLTTLDFAAYCEWDKDDLEIGCGLRYEEFVSLCVDQIQKLKARVNELEQELKNK